jgi:thymidine kinase
MFSGKTTRLIELIDKYSKKYGDNVLVLKPHLDNRYAIDSIVSHNKYSVAAKAVKQLSYEAIFSKYSTIGYIFIDEGHMFGESIVEFAEQLRGRGTHLFITAVDHVFDGSDFECITNLIQKSDWAYHLQGKCDVIGCENKSEYSHLKSSQKRKAFEKIVVGGSDLYSPLCEFHFKLAKNEEA